MSASTLDRMFEPFFTTKQTGRGLGLAAVLGVVRAHRGAIEVESAVDTGTTFRVFLPANDGSLPRRTRAPDRQTRLAARVLVVDDTPEVRATVSRMLGAAGAEVISAADGAEAIEVVAREAPRLDAVVLDLTMPRMDGAHTRERLRELAPDLPVLVMSGYADDEQVRAMLALPCTRFLAKPFGAAELIASLRALLEGD